MRFPVLPDLTIPRDMPETDQTTASAPEEGKAEKPRRAAAVPADSDPSGSYPTVAQLCRDSEARLGQVGYVVRAALRDLDPESKLSVEEAKQKVRGFLSRKVKVESEDREV